MKQLRHRLHEIIFEADTRAGKNFDIALLIAIFASVLTVMLESVASIQQQYGDWLRIAEWVLTILFTVEYALRLWCVTQPLNYAKSFFGIVDVLAVLPTYLGLLFTGTHYLVVVRALRLLRVFRVLKLSHYLGQANELVSALKASVPKITVFLGTVMTLAVMLGALMYMIEGAEHGFTSIPRAVYWAIVTLTTVGYGDISPQTPLGQAIASLVMIMGYGILAVPTGIVSAELVASSRAVSTQSCRQCCREGHDPDALHCKFCGALLNP